jgi:hypothetical protein
MTADEMKLCRKLREDPWAFAPFPARKPSPLFGFAYRYGGHVLGLSIFAAALLLCGY